MALQAAKRGPERGQQASSSEVPSLSPSSLLDAAGVDREKKEKVTPMHMSWHILLRRSRTMRGSDGRWQVSKGDFATSLSEAGTAGYMNAPPAPRQTNC
jgi:hypothetical protein